MNDRLSLSVSRTLWYTRYPVATATGVALETGLFDAKFGDGTVAFRNIRELGRDHTTVWPLLDQAMRHRLRVQIDFLHRHGYLEHDVDIDAWAQPQFLAEAYRREQLAPR